MNEKNAVEIPIYIYIKVISAKKPSKKGDIFMYM